MHTQTPFDLLGSIVSELNLSEQPLTVGDKRYRPTVFQEKASKKYVCCLLPISIVPVDVFEGLNTQYEKYLQGGSTDDYVFFNHEDPEQLKNSVINWYRNSTN